MRCSYVRDIPVSQPSQWTTALGKRQYARIVHSWVQDIGLDSTAHGTHSMRRTKASLIIDAPRIIRSQGYSAEEHTIAAVAGLRLQQLRNLRAGRPRYRKQQHKADDRNGSVYHDEPLGQRQLPPVVVQIEDDTSTSGHEEEDKRGERHSRQPDGRSGVKQQRHCRSSQEAVQHRKRWGRLSIACEADTRHDEATDCRNGEQDGRRPKNQCSFHGVLL